MIVADFEFYRDVGENSVQKVLRMALTYLHSATNNFLFINSSASAKPAPVK